MDYNKILEVYKRRQQEYAEVAVKRKMYAAPAKRENNKTTSQLIMYVYNQIQLEKIRHSLK